MKNVSDQMRNYPVGQATDIMEALDYWADVVEKLEAVAGEYRSLGYHSRGQERCRHGMSQRIGDHCKYDSRALAGLVAAEEEEVEISPQHKDVR